MNSRSTLFALLVLSLTAACGGGGGGSSTSGTSTNIPTGGGGFGGGGAGTGGGGSFGGGSGTGSLAGAFSFDVGVGGSGGIVGPVFRFGSIVVNDLVMNTDTAEFFVEGLSGASQSDLRVGQQVVIAGDLGALIANEVYYRANIKGPVSAPPVVIDPLLGTGTLTVLGQTVRLSAQSRYSDTTLGTLAAGDLLEISGTVDADGVVAATFVRRLSALNVYKATGTISNLSSDSASFSLGGLQVNTTSAALEDFPNDMLANGQLVEVRIPAADFSPPASASAAEIELLPQPQIAEGAEVEVKGIINQFSSETDFSVGGIRVTTTQNTEFENGASSRLGLGSEVEVEGVANAAGIIVADEIELERNSSVRYEGTVTAVDAALGTFTVEFGLVFRTGSYTEFEDKTGASADFTLGDLSAGDYVQLLAFREGSELAAVDVERDDPDPRLQLRGRVSGIDEAGSSLIIAGAQVREDVGVTVYFDDEEREISRSEFYSQLNIGASVQARWDNFSAADLPADRLQLEQEEN